MKSSIQEEQFGKDYVNTEVQSRNNPSAHVLVADDDVPLGNFLRRQLETESYKVDLVQDGELASQAIARDKYHLLILDLNMPKMDGLAVLNHIRPKQPQLPILVLTARTQVEDRVLSLDSGADDCLLKPFSFSELMARVRALLRRNPYLPGSNLQVGDLILDNREYRVERAGKRIKLSSKEFALLEFLMRNARQTVTRAMIMEHVWNMPFDNSTNLVDVYIKYVRDKVDSPEFSTQMIHTVRGVGYLFSDN
jgi:two-component system, OmpR family, copper resistance phosphate regulon response regulator CusR